MKTNAHDQNWREKGKTSSSSSEEVMLNMQEYSSLQTLNTQEYNRLLADDFDLALWMIKVVLPICCLTRGLIHPNLTLTINVKWLNEAVLACLYIQQTLSRSISTISTDFEFSETQCFVLLAATNSPKNIYLIICWMLHVQIERFAPPKKEEEER